MPRKSSTAGRKTKHAHLLPYPTFPLSPHPLTRRWYKVIKGRRHYFGALDDPDAALAKYERQRDDLYAGRTPREPTEGLLLRDLLNRFLTAKQRKVDAGELKQGTFGEYYRVSQRLVEAFGRNRAVDDVVADDFGQLRAQLAKTLGPSELGKQVQLVRSVFKFAYDSGYIDKPVRFGAEFTRPSRKTLRKAKRGKPVRLFTPEQIHAILAEVSVPLYAMTMLGINCGFGNTDCSELPQSVVDFDKAVIDWARPKTEIDRRCPLWPETMAALKAAIEQRPKPNTPSDKDLAFVTARGNKWVRFQRRNPDTPGAAIDSLGLEFGKVLRRLGFKQQGVGFYALRHVHRTVADAIPDRAAVDLIMGHENAHDMRTPYVEAINDDRLVAVTTCVHDWLYGKVK